MKIDGKNMNGIKYLLVISLLTGIIGVNCVIAETITDSKDDVYHWKWDEDEGIHSWSETSSSKNNIDIDKISYDSSNQKMILTMKVHGSIQNTEAIVYWIYYNTTGGYYSMSYSNGTGFCMALSTVTNDFLFGTVTTSVDTITGVVNSIGDNTMEEFYGWVGEYTRFGDTSDEWWGDWAPQDTSPWYGLEDNGDNTPGFEIILVIGAISTALILKKGGKFSF